MENSVLQLDGASPADIWTEVGNSTQLHKPWYHGELENMQKRVQSIIQWMNEERKR